MSNRASLLAVAERPDYGIIATLRSNDGIVTTAREFMGPVKPALYELAAYCDRHGMKVVCLSTPQTIYSDLQHRWMNGRGKMTLPEENLLGWINRMDLRA